ncbi:MAG: 4Fe-4S binding protein [Acidobacteriota bacterium]|nr:4Fe-4S binding protein [Acidobacteriota bacterium]
MSSSDSVNQEKPPSAGIRKKDQPPAEIVINIAWCKGCGICVDFCKPQAIEMKGPVVSIVSVDKCTRCRMCEAMCPDFAIEIDPPVPMEKMAAKAREGRR